jgi:hypothetical protein
MIEVIHAGAAEGTIGGREASRLDDVRLHPQARAKAKYSAGVLRDVRLIKRDPHGSRVCVLTAIVCNYGEASLPSQRGQQQIFDSRYDFGFVPGLWWDRC